MSLSVSISKGGTTYNLRVDTLTHSFTRFPTQSPLPADENGNPQVFSLDLGMSLEQILLTGIVNTTSSGSGDPSKVDLETVCRNWWAYGDNVTDLPTLTISSGQSYRVHLKNAEFRQMSAMEDRWEMSLIFLIREKT
jgi:hypothetical protein